MHDSVVHVNVEAVDLGIVHVDIVVDGEALTVDSHKLLAVLISELTTSHLFMIYK